MTCHCTMYSPFHWSEFPRPSIFSTDPAFTYGASTGKTMGQIASATVTVFEKKNGRSLGTVGGISDKADKAAAERQYQRQLHKKKRA